MLSARRERGYCCAWEEYINRKSALFFDVVFFGTCPSHHISAVKATYGSHLLFLFSVEEVQYIFAYLRGRARMDPNHTTAVKLGILPQ